MKHKTIAIVATIMAAVFLIIVVVYPMIFSPNKMTPVTTPNEPVMPPISH